MTLPEISKEINFKISLRKFFYDFATALSPSLPLLFDQGMQIPVDSGSASPKWLTVEFGSFLIGSVNMATVDVYCCAQKDTDADEVTKLRDIVVANFTDSTKIDGIRRIPFYINLNTVDEEIIGYIMAEVAFQSSYLRATDGTKYKIITLNLRWGATYV